MSKLFGINRRRFLAGAAGTTVASFGLGAFAAEVVEEIANLKPGQFTWHPDRQPDGAVAVVVSLPEQLVHVYRNGVRIAVSTCSSGKPGHETPTGVFVVLQKDKNHHSSTYNDAPMPNMNRLTWSGIALHAGQLPGYPASHGCVRLPLDFSAKLFEITHLGTPVIISGSHSDPWELLHPGLVLSGYAENEFVTVEGTLKGKSEPSDWADEEVHPVVSIVASSVDKQVELIRDGDVIAKGSLTIAGDAPLGNHVFVLNGPHAGVQGMSWVSISYGADDTKDQAIEASALQRVQADKAFVEVMKQQMHPGTVMILIDTPLEPDTRTGADFVIMTEDA